MKKILDAINDGFNPFKPFQREVACFYAGSILSMSTSGSAGAVEFDFFRIWERFRDMEPRPNSVIMLHTHPPQITEMSSIDKNMVHGWRTALGVEVYFLVITDEGVRFYMFPPGRGAGEDLGFSSWMSVPPPLRMVCHVMMGISRAGESASEVDLDEIVCSLNGCVAQGKIFCWE